MAEILLYYATTDQVLADDAAAALAAAGMTVVKASWDDGTSAAVDGASADLRQAACIVMLWSQAVARIDGVQSPVRLALHAWSTERLVLAVADGSSLPAGLGDLPVINLAADRDAGVRRIVDTVRGVVAANAGRGSGSPTAMRPKPSRVRRQILAGVAAAAVLGAVGLLSTNFMMSPPETYPTVWQLDKDGGLRPDGDVAPKTRSPQSLPPEVEVPRATPVSPPPPPPWPEPVSAPPPPPPPSAWDHLRMFLSEPSFDGALAAWPWLAGALAVLLSGAAVVLVRARRMRQAQAEQGVATVAADTGLHEIFVSYSRQDTGFVDLIVQHIEGAGFTVWIDREGTGHGGQRYAAPIVKAIRASRLVALMCSRNAFMSHHVVREVYVAGDFKKPFIVVQLDHAQFPDEFTYFLSGYPRIPADDLPPKQLEAEIRRYVA